MSSYSSSRNRPWKTVVSGCAIPMIPGLIYSSTIPNCAFANSCIIRRVVECVLRLLEKGFGSQITLAHDICTLIQFRHYGGWGWDHLLSNIVPRLRHAGVSQQELDVMFIETSRRLLTFTE